RVHAQEHAAQAKLRPRYSPALDVRGEQTHNGLDFRQFWHIWWTRVLYVNLDPNIPMRTGAAGEGPVPWAPEGNWHMPSRAEIPEPKPSGGAERMRVRTRILKVNLPPEGFRLVSGRFLKSVDVAYETYGALNAAASNAVLICSPLTTDAHAAGYNPDYEKPKERVVWWDDMIGPGKAIETNRYFVIASNMLGGCKGTTGPASINPDTGLPYGSAFPKITVEDMVGVQRLLVLELGIDVLEAVVGGSMGGMQALQWSVSFPDKVRKCICIAAAARLSAPALGFEIIGRKVIVNAPDFRSGDFYRAAAVRAS